MGLVGREVIQSRVWLDPNAQVPPNLNYKFTFPITVFDAVRRDMDDEQSETLAQVLEKLDLAIDSKQTIIPARPANYIVTYSGVAGSVGAIQISNEIPWEESEQTHTRIPSEKAVGDLIRKLGVNPNDPSSGYNIRWSDIVGRPNIYSSLGNNEFGLVSQKTITESLNKLSDRITENNDVFNSSLESLIARTDDHLSNQNNPHNVTLKQLGGVSEEAFNHHVNADNPHNITKELLGLGNVDNTSDLDKPMSTVTKEAIDKINTILDNMSDDVGELSFITEIDYNSTTSTLDLEYRDGSIVSVSLPIGKSINDIRFNSATKELIFVDNAGNEEEINLEELYNVYKGYEGSDITLSIDEYNTIRAEINNKGITSRHINDEAILTRHLDDQSVTSVKIKDNAITDTKLAEDSVTTSKIVDKAITTDKLEDRSITPRTLFSANNDNRILAVLKANEDPVWSQVNADMIAYNAIESKHIMKDAVTYDKIAPNAVGTNHLEDASITTDKLNNSAVTTDKLADGSVTSNKLAPSLILEGKPTLRNSPDINANNNQIVDTSWVREFAKEELVVTTSNIEKRAVTGEKLFSSSVKDRVLGVLISNGDPEWIQINREMLEDNIINTSKIVDLSVTNEKLADKSIQSRNLNKNIIQESHIEESAITSEKIYKSHEANRVLAALSEEGHPVYSQVTEEMLAHNTVGADHIKDGSITPSKFVTSEEGQVVLGVGLSDTVPKWTKIANSMILDRAIDGSKLFSSDRDNMILAVTDADQNAAWAKVTGQMIDLDTIESRNIKYGAVGTKQIADGAVTSDQIAEDAIEDKHIAYASIAPNKINPSSVPERIIATTGLPYSAPIWTQVNTKMIEDSAINGDKLFRSKVAYRVIGVTQPGAPAEYTMITHEFIADGTITPQKLMRDFTLLGTPSLTVSPPDNSDDFSLANTAWVRNTITDMIQGIEPSNPSVDISNIPDHSIDGTKLFTHSHAPRVLGVTAPNSDVEFILINESLIENGAITTDKIKRSIQLLGSPSIEVRPSSYASDANGEGTQIPDCQWVLDKIKEQIAIALTPTELTHNDKVWVMYHIDTAFSAVGLNVTDATDEFDYSTDIDIDKLEDYISIGETDKKWIIDTIDAELKKAGYQLDNDPSNDQLEVYVDDYNVTLSNDSKLWVIDAIDSAFSATAVKIIDPTASNPNESMEPDYTNNGNSGTTNVVIDPGSISTIYLQDRAVTAQKLFTSENSNRVLAVLDANSDPQYVQINNEMISDRAVDSRTLFSSEIPERILGVHASGSDPIWTQITSQMIGDAVLTNDHIVEGTITGDKIKHETITILNLSNTPMINEHRLMSNAVTSSKLADESVVTAKLADEAVTNDKIADKTITGNKLEDDLVLHENTSVQSSRNNYEQRAIRNIIISPNGPTGGKNSDIWFKFA